MGDWKKIILGDILTESKIESIAPNIESRIRVLLNAKGIIKRPVKKETKGATKYFIRKKGQLEEFVFLLLFGNSKRILAQVKTSTHGTCRLENSIYSYIIIGLPPIPEQDAIVTKVEKLLAVCDQLGSQITTNQTHAEQLMQAVLKEAFQQSEAE